MTETNCTHCDLPIKEGDASKSREDLHQFCYELWKGECIEELDRALRASPDYVEVSPGKWQRKEAKQ